MKYDIKMERLNEASRPNSQHANQTQWIGFRASCFAPMVNGDIRNGELEKQASRDLMKVGRIFFSSSFYLFQIAVFSSVTNNNVPNGRSEVRNFHI